MSVRRKKPHGRSGRPVTRWEYASVKNGGSAVGFIAGPPTGAYVHLVGRVSKPCRSVMSDGALSCPYCGGGEPVWRGYVPFYDSEYLRKFVLIPEDLDESVSEIPLHAQIKLTRDKHKTSPCVIRAATWRTNPIPPNADREAAVDMMPFLVSVLWKDADLLAWHNASDAPMQRSPQPAKHIHGDGSGGADELAKIAGQVAKRLHVRASEDKRSAAEILAGIGEEAPTRNGRHKPK